MKLQILMFTIACITTQPPQKIDTVSFDSEVCEGYWSIRQSDWHWGRTIFEEKNCACCCWVCLWVCVGHYACKSMCVCVFTRQIKSCKAVVFIRGAHVYISICNLHISTAFTVSHRVFEPFLFKNIYIFSQSVALEVMPLKLYFEANEGITWAWFMWN